MCWPMQEPCSVSFVQERLCWMLFVVSIQVGPSSDRQWEATRQKCWAASYVRRRFRRVRRRWAEKMRMNPPGSNLLRRRLILDPAILKVGVQCVGELCSNSPVAASP